MPEASVPHSLGRQSIHLMMMVMVMMMMMMVMMVIFTVMMKTMVQLCC